MIGWFYPDVSPDVPRAKWDETGRSSAARAIELDPNLAEAHASRAVILWDDYEYAAAEREFKLAVSLNPSYSLAHSFYAGLLQDEGRADEAVVEYTLAEAADPLWTNNLLNFARLLVWLRRLDEALGRIQKLGELEPSGRAHHLLRASYHLARSDLERYLEEMNQVEELQIEPRWKTVERAMSFAVSGEKDRSRALLRNEETLPEFPAAAWGIAYVYAELGDLDECFRWLDKAFQSHILPLQAFRLDPRLEHVRSDSRFQTLLKRMNLA